MDYEEMKNKFIDIIRWIGIVPTAIVSWFIVYWIINLLYRIFSPVEMTEWAITIMSSAGSGAAFVYCGSLMAPNGRKIVSIVLATIMTMFVILSAVFSLYGYGNDSTIITLMSCVSTVVGCIISSSQIYSEEL